MFKILREEHFLMQKKKKIVDYIGEENIEYCFCGSGFFYKDCCGNYLNKKWYTDYNIRKQLNEINNKIYNKKNIDKNSDINSEINKLYKIFEEKGRLAKCIGLECSGKPIASHLFPKSFIRDKKKEGFEFSLNGIKKELGADSFKMKLWCEKHDQDLFKTIDRKKDIGTILKKFSSDDKTALSELFIKTLSFKVKTFILEQMYCFLGILFNKDEEKEKYLEGFKKKYLTYNTLLKYFDGCVEKRNGKRISFPNLIGKDGLVKGCAEKSKIYYQTNIKVFGNDLFFVINIVNDGDWMYFVGNPVESKINGELDKYKSELEKFKKEKDVDGAFDFINNKFNNGNNIYFLDIQKSFMGNTFIYGTK